MTAHALGAQRDIRLCWTGRVFGRTLSVQGRLMWPRDRIRVVWVTRKAFGLSDGRRCRHPFKLSDDWTVGQMQIVWDLCSHNCIETECVTTGGIKKKRRKPVFRPDIGYIEAIRALEACGYKQIKAVEILGVPHSLLQHRIRKYKITHPKWIRHKPL